MMPTVAPAEVVAAVRFAPPMALAHFRVRAADVLHEHQQVCDGHPTHTVAVAFGTVEDLHALPVRTVRGRCSPGRNPRVR